MMMCAAAVAHNLQWTVKPQGTLTSLRCPSVPAHSQTMQGENSRRIMRREGEKTGFSVWSGAEVKEFISMASLHSTPKNTHFCRYMCTQSHKYTHITHCFCCWLLIISSFCLTVVGDCYRKTLSQCLFETVILAMIKWQYNTYLTPLINPCSILYTSQSWIHATYTCKQHSINHVIYAEYILYVLRKHCTAESYIYPTLENDLESVNQILTTHVYTIYLRW